MPSSGEAVMENVRKYRVIASLYRRTAAFRPLQSASLLRQAGEWEQLAVAELEAYFNRREPTVRDLRPGVPLEPAASWNLVAAA